MKGLLLAAAVAVGSVALSAMPASAQDWWQEVMRQSASVQTAPERAARKSARSERSARAAERRRAAASIDDDSRPQRRAAPRARVSNLNLTGGQSGVASYYWQPQRVASGGWFNPNAMTAAHKTLPFGTRVRVTRMDNGNSVVVTINDRGPYIAGRIIDLSRRAAQAIGITGQGLARVQVSVLGR